MKTTIKCIISIALVALTVISAFGFSATAASINYSYGCSCKSLYNRLGSVPGQKTSCSITNSKELSREYGSYQRGKIENPQVGYQYFVAKGTQYSIDYSFSLTPNVTIPLLSTKLGVSIKNSKEDISGIVSPPVIKGKQWVAVYTRQAYKVFEVTEQCTVTCPHNTVLSSTTRTYIVKVGYRDAAAIRFGAASSYDGLNKSVSGKDNPLFIW